MVNDGPGKRLKGINRKGEGVKFPKFKLTIKSLFKQCSRQKIIIENQDNSVYNFFYNKN